MPHLMSRVGNTTSLPEQLTEWLEITPCKPNSHLNKSSLGLASSWAPYSALPRRIDFFYKHYNCLCRGHWNYYTKLVHLTNSDSSNSQVLKIIIRNKRFSNLCTTTFFRHKILHYLGGPFSLTLLLSRLGSLCWSKRFICSRQGPVTRQIGVFGKAEKSPPFLIFLSH